MLKEQPEIAAATAETLPHLQQKLRSSHGSSLQREYVTGDE
jgi:hypothetical protein